MMLSSEMLMHTTWSMMKRFLPPASEAASAAVVGEMYDDHSMKEKKACPPYSSSNIEFCCVYFCLLGFKT